MATYRKRIAANGAVTWQARVRMTGAPPITATHATLKAAKAWAKGEESRVEEARARHAGNVTLADAIKRYIVAVLPQKAASTRRSDAGRLRWWAATYGGLPLSGVTSGLLAAARDELLAGGAKGPTVNRYLAAVSAVLARAAGEWEWLRSNPAAGVKRFKESLGRVRYLSAEEIEALLAACPPVLRTIVAVALATGIRQGELFRLRLRDVNLARRVIVLHVTKSGDRRGLPIPRPLVARLRWYLRYYHPNRGDADALLFPAARKGTKNAWWSYRKQWYKAVAGAKLVDFHYHDLRHTTASYLAMNGATTREIMEVLGHRTAAMAQRYSHLSPAHVAGVVERISTQVLPPRGARRSRREPPPSA